MRAAGDDPPLVPFAHRQGPGTGGRVHAVHGAGMAVGTVAAVGVAFVVEDLVFDAGPVRGFLILAGAVEHAAVAARGDLPFEAQVEVAVRAVADQVAAGRRSGESTVHDRPTRHRRAGF